jgi:hypothetical protein
MTQPVAFMEHILEALFNVADVVGSLIEIITTVMDELKRHQM